ncbi:unnamed protein product [Aphanomyces euteiches]
MVSPLAWLIALSATGVVAQATTCSSVVEDMDYPGNDVGQTNRANHANCCNDCTKTAGCNLYVWTSWNGGTCFLKSSPKTTGGETPQPGARSARISPVQQTQCSQVVDGVDYPGNDLAETNRANHADCCNDCAATPGCAAYVWTTYNDGTCFLKSKASKAQAVQGAKAAHWTPLTAPPTPSTAPPTLECSAVVDGVDYPGNDLAETSRANYADCCKDCAATFGCAAYVWTSLNGGTCFLKSKADKTQAVPGAKAALRTTTTPPPTNPQCSQVVDGVDYPGNDLAETRRANYADCCNDCTATPGCAAYVWTSYNDGTCFLKSAAGEAQAVPGAKAAVRTMSTSPPPSPVPQCSQVVDGVDYPGNDLAETRRANYADCCKDCAATSGCAAYVWTSLNGGTCFLKSKAGDAQPVPGAKAATWAPSTTTPTTPSPVVTTPAPTPVPTKSAVCLETVKGYGNWIPVVVDSNGDVASYGQFGKSYSKCMADLDWHDSIRVSCGCDFKTKYPEFGSTGYDLGPDFWCNTGKAYFNAQPPSGTCAPIATPSPSPTPRPKQTLPPKPTTSSPPPLKCFNSTKDVKFAGINLTETNRASHTDCCNDCAQTLGCDLYVWTLGTCYLKSKPKKSDTNSGNELFPGAWSAEVLSEFRKQPIPPPEFRQCRAPASISCPGNDIAQTNRTNFMDCCGDCTSTPNCVFYEWKDDICFLKSKYENCQHDNDVTSADVRRCTPFELDLTYKGGDLMIETAKREDCCRLCTKTEGCTRFSHFGGKCYLKNGDLAIKSTRLGAASATVY